MKKLLAILLTGVLLAAPCFAKGGGFSGRSSSSSYGARSSSYSPGTSRPLYSAAPRTPAPLAPMPTARQQPIINNTTIVHDNGGGFWNFMLWNSILNHPQQPQTIIVQQPGGGAAAPAPQTDLQPAVISQNIQNDYPASHSDAMRMYEILAAGLLVAALIILAVFINRKKTP